MNAIGLPNVDIVKWPRGTTLHLDQKSVIWSLTIQWNFFTKIDPSRTGKENVLIMTNAFSKFSITVMMLNQRALTVARVMVDKWFHIYGVPSHIHSDQGKSFDNDIICAFCKMYGVEQSLTCPYNQQGNAQCEGFNCTLFDLLHTLSKEQKAD